MCAGLRRRHHQYEAVRGEAARERVVQPSQNLKRTSAVCPTRATAQLRCALRGRRARRCACVRGSVQGACCPSHAPPRCALRQRRPASEATRRQEGSAHCRYEAGGTLAALGHRVLRGTHEELLEHERQRLQRGVLLHELRHVPAHDGCSRVLTGYCCTSFDTSQRTASDGYSRVLARALTSQCSGKPHGVSHPT